MAGVTLLAEIGGTLLEGPLWDASANRLLWLDIPARRLAWLGDDGLGSCSLPDHVGSFCLAADDSILLAGGSGLWRLPGLHAHPSLVSTYDLGLATVNDGKVGPDGAFWFGTASREDAGALFRCDAGFQVERVRHPIGMSNGIGWSPDGSVMYHVDSTARRIWASSFSVAHVDDRRPFVTFAPDDGMPDGLAVDDEGGVWVAMWGRGQVRRFDADGRLSSALDLPDLNVTSCCWIGAEGDVLVITTARDDTIGTGGHLYQVRPGSRGVPIGRFGMAERAS